MSRLRAASDRNPLRARTAAARLKVELRSARLCGLLCTYSHGLYVSPRVYVGRGKATAKAVMQVATVVKNAT